MDNLERLCKIDIVLDNPVQSSAGYDCLLLIGDAPVSPKDDATVYPVGIYTNLDEVTDVGWVAVGEDAEPIGRAARIAFSQSPKPNQIYIAVRQQVAVEGEADQTAPEDITATLARALETPGWYVICPAGISEKEYKTIAEWTETRNLTFAFTTMKTTNPVDNHFYRSFGIYAKPVASASAEEIPADNEYAHVAMAAKCLCYDSGSETWANQVINGITPSVLPSPLSNALDAANLSYVIKVGGKVITQGGKTAAGEWIDLIRFRDWLQNNMAQRVCDLLIRNPKIPYTDNGIAAVENQMVAALKEGQVRGGIPETEYDELDQPIPGYKTDMPLAASLTSAQRASRTLKGCKFSARIAGAIHMVEISGSLTYSF